MTHWQKKSTATLWQKKRPATKLSWPLGSLHLGKRCTGIPVLVVTLDTTNSPLTAPKPRLVRPNRSGSLRSFPLTLTGGANGRVLACRKSSPCTGGPETTRLYLVGLGLVGLGQTMDEVFRLHEPGLVGVSCRLRSVPNIELGEDALDVCLYRSLADYEGFGDFGVGVPSGDELKDLLFATCEGGGTSQFRCGATTGEDGCRFPKASSRPPCRPLGDDPTGAGIVGIVFALGASMSPAHVACRAETRLTRCISTKKARRPSGTRTRLSFTVSTTGITPPNSSARLKTPTMMGAPTNAIATELNATRPTNVPIPIGNCANRYTRPVQVFRSINRVHNWERNDCPISIASADVEARFE